MPNNIEDWRDYVRTVAARYKGRIHEYEIWNEPNLQHFFSGNVDDMLLLTREAARVLKEVDSSNLVVSPSPMGAPGLTWFQRFLARGGGKYVDVIAYHFYVIPHSPEAMVPIVERVRGLMQQYGQGEKPLWNTETGWMIQNKSGTIHPWGPFRRVLSSRVAAAYVGRAYILNWAYGVQRFYWYSWDNPGFGMTEANGSELRPAAVAFMQIERWLVGTKMKSCNVDQQNTWNCEFQAESGAPFRIAWNPHRKLNFRPSWHVANWMKLTGSPVRSTGRGTMTLSAMPVLIYR